LSIAAMMELNQAFAFDKEMWAKKKGFHQLLLTKLGILGKN